MKILANQTGVVAPDAAYPNGSILDGATIIGEGINQDIVQFLQKLAIDGGIAENDLPDNVTNGYQLIEALQYFTKWLKSGGTYTLTIAANIIDISYLPVDSYRHLIAINGSALDAIFNPITSGDYACQSFTARVSSAITINNNGNIFLNGRDSIKFAAGTSIEFLYNDVTNKWSVRAYSPIGINESWTTPTPGANWVNGGIATAQDLQFRKNKIGQIEMRGWVAKGVGASASMFTLPAGYRPNDTQRYQYNGSGTSGYMDINADGTINLSGGSDSDIPLNVIFVTD